MADCGKCFGYTGTPCPNCGRYRLELYENSKRVCEKCNWCVEDESYIDRELMYELDEWHLKLNAVKI